MDSTPGQTQPPAPFVSECLKLEARMWKADRDAAIGFLRQAVRRLPGEPRLLGRLAARAGSVADWRDGPLDVGAIVAAGQGALSPLATMCLSDDPVLHHACAAHHAAQAPTLPPFRHGPGGPRERLRIGYLSPDFRDHPMGQCMANVLEEHDRDRFEILGYSLRAWDSPLRTRIEAGFDRFVEIGDLEAAEAAALIRRDGIDILVELIGYNGFDGCAILASRPAPVQVSLLGFPGTKAGGSIDYLVGDPTVLGDGAAAHFTERLVVLPETYFPTDGRPLDLGTAPSREDAGLPDAAFVFCCFNFPQKITPAMFDVWMRILRRVDGAVLWLLAPWPGVDANLRREAAARGIAPERIVFAGFAPHREHLSRLRLADLALDTLPCGAHTTAIDTLRAGVPMLTCLGRSFAGRVGASLLGAVGLPDLIVRDLDSFEDLAVRLAGSPPRLASLRARLGRNLSTTPLFDCPRYTRHLETAYETMWTIHREGGAPRAFGVVPA